MLINAPFRSTLPEANEKRVFMIDKANPMTIMSFMVDLLWKLKV
jgi:hypothetical protein